MSEPPRLATVTSTMDVADTDEVLMLRYRDGDGEAFAVLYHRYKGALYRYFVRQCPTAALAEELFQDVWLNLVHARERYTVQAKFTTYLFRLAHHRLIDYYRRQSSASVIAWNDGAGPEVEELPVAAYQEPDNQLYIRTQVARLLDLIQALPEVQREAFLLREEAGMSIADIAETTGVDRETAKSRLRYALARIRRGLRGER
jgi:RNA polymerase sigma-70 factor (ECF subfamily)